MANISDVSVRICAKKCAKEVREWLNAIDKEAVYDICSDHEGYNRDDLGDNSADFVGYASGRWTYQNNIIGALSPDKKERECWSGECAEKEYQKLIEKLAQDHEAGVSIDYKEVEIGLAFIGAGGVDLLYDKDSGKVETSFCYDDEELTPKTLIEYGFADNEQDAKEYMGIGVGA